MKVPGIEEMARTFAEGAGQPIPEHSVYARGLLAVFETHVGPMLRDLYVRAGGGEQGADLYVKGILSQLKEPRHD